jgi:hypothetical protein
MSLFFERLDLTSEINERCLKNRNLVSEDAADLADCLVRVKDYRPFILKSLSDAPVNHHAESSRESSAN